MNTRYLAIMLLLAGCNATGASEASPYVHRSFEVHPEIFSFMPGEGVDSIQRHGTGMAAVGGTLGLGVRIDQKSYMVDLSPFLKDDRFGVTVKVKLKGDEPRTERFDLNAKAFRRGIDAAALLVISRLLCLVERHDLRGPCRGRTEPCGFSRYQWDGES